MSFQANIYFKVLYQHDASRSVTSYSELSSNTIGYTAHKQLHKNRLTDTELNYIPDIPGKDLVPLTHAHQGQEWLPQALEVFGTQVRSGPIIIKQDRVAKARDGFQGYPSGWSQFAITTRTWERVLYNSMLLSLPTYVCTIATAEKCTVRSPVRRTKATNDEILKCPMSHLVLQ